MRIKFASPNAENMNYPDTYSKEEQLEMDKQYDVLLKAWNGVKKEALTMEKIASDLKIMADFHTGVVTEMWQVFIIPVVLIGILLGFLFERVA